MWYNVLAGDPELMRREVLGMHAILEILIAVEAGLILDLIRTWLNGDNRR